VIGQLNEEVIDSSDIFTDDAATMLVCEGNALNCFGDATCDMS
jgi:hypothetical protein